MKGDIKFRDLVFEFLAVKYFTVNSSVSKFGVLHRYFNKLSFVKDKDASPLAISNKPVTTNDCQQN